MSQPLRTSSAVSLIVLATMIAGCAAPQGHVGAASALAGKPQGEVGLGTRALAALNSNNPTLAVQLAEQAAAKSPQDQEVRNLLANAYFAAGRFASAESAYKDTLTINANQPEAILKLALVEIAQGKDAEAVGLLNSARSVLDASDYGLALALAGRPQLAIAVLEPAARQVGADATVRQNLALAYAFAGNWDQARLIASQDVPGNLLDARIQQWMQLANPKHASDQVAALIGVTPAAVDSGEPVQIALNKSETQVAQVAPAATQPKGAAAAAAPAVAPAAAPAPKPAVVSIATPPAPPVVVAVAPAPPPARSTLATMAASAMSEAKAVLASVLPHHDAPAPKPHRVAAVVRPASHRGNAPVVVQLGAYNSADRVLAGWNRQARKYGALKAYLPMSARFASPKGVFYRLSVRGFDSVGDAYSLCNTLRREGGTCFVRNVAGDQPVQYASR